MKHLEKTTLVILFSIAISLLLSTAAILKTGTAFSVGTIAGNMSYFIIINLPVVFLVLFIELINEGLKRRLRMKSWANLTINKKLMSIGWKVALGKIVLWALIFINLESLTKSS